MLDKLYISGEWVDAIDKATMPIINPATCEVVCHVAAGSALDIDSAVQAAQMAYPIWSNLSATERCSYLIAFADRVIELRHHLANQSMLVNGKPLAEALVDVDDVISTFRYYAGMAATLDQQQNRNVELPHSDFNAHLRFDPVGVVGLITPWNFPLLTSSWKIAPALAAGCTIVFKPSEIVAPVELELGRIAHEIGLPAGVLNIVTGAGAEIGSALCEHSDVAKISFTGSNAVGAKVMQAASNNAKSVSLELGGKSPIIVFADTEIEQAVELIIAGIFYNCGQMCSATSRLLVNNNIADELLAKLVSKAQAITIGEGNLAGVQMGPLTTVAQLDKVESAVTQAIAEGARLLVGGKRVVTLGQGLFFEPTILETTSTTSALWRDEIFGPVLAVHRFNCDSEAIKLANDCDYGLAATLVTENEERIERICKELRAGHIWVNSPQIVFVETSWGGFKRSGIGRELGPWGLDAYREVKHVVRYKEAGQ